MANPKDDISKALNIAEKTFRECGHIPDEEYANLHLQRIENTRITHGAPNYLERELKNNINPYVRTIIQVGKLLQGGIHEIDRDGSKAKEMGDSVVNEINILREEAAAGLAAVDVAEKLYEGLESNLEAILDEHGNKLKEISFPRENHGETWFDVMEEFLETLEGEREEFVRERERFRMIMNEELGLGPEQIDELGRKMESEFVEQISNYRNIPDDVKSVIR